MKSSTCDVHGRMHTGFLWFHKGHVHVDVIWARADAIRFLEHPYAKLSNLPMQDPYGFLKPRKEPIRDPQWVCTIILKAEWGPYSCGPVCDPYGPIRRMTVYGPKWKEARV